MKDKEYFDNNYFSDKLFISYQKEYYNQKCELCEYFLNIENKDIYFLYTLTKITDINYKISFFSLPARILCKKYLSLRDINKIKLNLLKIYDAKNINFSFSFLIDQEQINLEKLKKINPLSIEETQQIDLNLSEQQILNNMKYNHRREIKKVYKILELKSKIINYKNFNDNILLEMKLMHKRVAGKKTRSDITWEIMGEMVKEKKAFIVLIELDTKPISFSFFFYNKVTISYFSSVTDREFFNLGGINHMSLWEAIKFAKNNIKLKKFDIGVTNYLYSRSDNTISEKEKNISFFKSRFCGKKTLQVIIDKNSSI